MLLNTFKNKKLIITITGILIGVTAAGIVYQTKVLSSHIIPERLLSLFSVKKKMTLPDLTIDKSAVMKQIETYTVDYKTLTDEIETLGQIIFYEKISVSSKVNGRLEKLYIHEGVKVNKNQLIAEIERLPLEIKLQQQYSELEISRKSYQLAKAKYENALKSIEIKLKTIQKARAQLIDKKVTFINMKKTYENKQKLYKIGGISKTELETVKTQYISVYTQYENAKSDYLIQQVGFRDKDIIDEGYKIPQAYEQKMALFKKINTKIERSEVDAALAKIKQVKNDIRSTKILLAESYIRSPITGIVASKNMEAGEMVKAESVIATIINLSQVFLSMNINEKDLYKIKLGQVVIFSIDAFINKEFRGKITRITPLLDMKTRTIEVKAEVYNKDLKLLPGMFARARISTGKSGKRLIIPKSALIKHENDNGELYIIKKGVVFNKEVKLGASFQENIEVTSGLVKGDIIIAKGIQVVYPGMELKQ